MRLLITAFMGLLPWPLYGQVLISEIMYDAPGTDAGHEWVEVRHEGGDELDLTTWKFFEGETNHALTTVQGGSLLSPGSFAVIADNPSQFLADHPGFTGVLFDSSFSLSNTGESLSLKDANGAEHGGVSYSAAEGAAGDGNSLQLLGSWAPGDPTPGAANTHAALVQEAEEDGTSASTPGSERSAASSASSRVSSGSTAPDTLSVQAGPDRRTVVGSMLTLSASLGGSRAPDIKDHSVKWNLGNGVTRIGKTVHYSYEHPGTYAVIVLVDQGDLRPSDKLIIRVEPAGILLSERFGKGIALENGTSEEIDLSGWSLSAGEGLFVIPHGTLLLPEAELLFSTGVTGLPARADGSSTLRFPSGEIAATVQPFGETEFALEEDPEATSLFEAPLERPEVEEEPSPEVFEEAPPADRSEEQAAAAALSSDLPWWTWILALLAFLGLAIGAYFLWRRNQEGDITIIE